jgi:hypothetical protein
MESKLHFAGVGVSVGGASRVMPADTPPWQVQLASSGHSEAQLRNERREICENLRMKGSPA